MTREQQAREHVAREQVNQAALRIKRAANEWNAVDLMAIENCEQSLEQSASELTEALEVLRDASPEVLRSLQTDLLALKNNTDRLARLTDSSASFLRCAPGASGPASEFYEPGGAIRYSAPEMEERGVQA